MLIVINDVVPGLRQMTVMASAIEELNLHHSITNVIMLAPQLTYYFSNLSWQQMAIAQYTVEDAKVKKNDILILSVTRSLCIVVADSTQKCPVCATLYDFDDQTVHHDHRPVWACLSGDIICADCFKKCRSRAKCPTCRGDILETLTAIQDPSILVENFASVQVPDISVTQMEQTPFASGGFGEVYRAKWQSQDVAVKVVLKASTKQEKEEAIVASRCEASLVRRLNHPNIIRIFGITSLKSNKLGIVMELANHGSLNSWVGKIKDKTKLANIALGIVDGLDYMHSQRVIHRDIKPNNILMFGRQDSMIPKIADFGVSKRIQTTMMTRTRVGQELYMAPEVKVFAKSSFPSDVYSLAMVLFELFNEQLIMKSPQEVQNFVMRILYSGMIENIPDSYKVPKDIRRIIVRGWDKNPNERPQPSEFRSALKG